MTADAEVAALAALYGRAAQANDAGTLRDLFDPSARLWGLAEDGSIATDSRDEWLARVAARAPGPGGEAEVESVEVTGPAAALARVRVAVGGQAWRDTLSLLKVGGAWRVVAKVWQAAP